MTPHSRRILLVDDHGLVREGLRLLLSGMMANSEIAEAASYAQAREILATSTFDLVLLDYYLPDRRGPEDLAGLFPLVGQAPIVVMSSECEGEFVRNVLSQGVRGFIPKHSTAQVMMAALGVVFSGGIYVPPDALASAGSGSSASPSPLTERQRDVLQLLVDGLTNKEIAAHLKTAESTVRVHLSAIFRALGVENRTQACSVALRDKLVRGSRGVS